MVKKNKFLSLVFFLFITFSASLHADNNIEMPYHEKKTAIIFDASRTLCYLIAGAWGGMALIDISLEFQTALLSNISYYFQAEGTLTYPLVYGVSTGFYIMPQEEEMKGVFIRTGMLAYYLYLGFLPHPATVSSDYSMTTIGGELTVGYQFIWDSGFLLSLGVGIRYGYNGEWILWPGIELARIGFAW